jgi:hypothetical protein
MNLTFMNEPAWRWVVFLVLASLVLGVWNGVVREMV